VSGLSLSKRIVFFAVLLVTMFLAVPAQAAPLPAFPGCEGFGCETPGGRGGAVLHVTNLNNSGVGSLRAAMTAAGPRIVVFDTGGTITLLSSIRVTSPFLTVAGQTAPGGGIQLKLDPSQDSGLLDINTTDVVIRGLKLRQGPHTAIDAAIPMEVTDADKVVIDHNSIYWATDENVTLYDNATNVTVSWNIIAEGLSNSTHYEGEHSRGLFISGDNAGPTTAHHNLMVHNMRRNPEASQAGVADIRNNVVYDYGTHTSLIADKRNNAGTNMVGNYYKPGPDSSLSREEIDGHHTSGFGPIALYVSGNERSNGQAARLDSTAQGWVVPNPVPAPAVTTTSATQALADVLAGAGARVQGVDAADARVLADVQNGTGSIIDNPSEVGGWPVLAAGSPPDDPDLDGMPTGWETTYGLNPQVNDSAQVMPSGYTAIEDYVNSFYTAVPPPPGPGGTPVPVPTSTC
jgi:pectate lyase